MNSEFKKLKSDSPQQYGLNIRKSLVVTLLIFNLCVILSPRVDVQVENPEPPKIIIDVENIPRTQQSRQNPPPPKPTIPVPSDKETVPEDATIEETTLKYTNIFDDLPGRPEFAGIPVTPPRPIAWVFPEYPDSEKQKRIHGVVKLSIHVDETGRVVEAIVLDNTTGSSKCAEAAKEAALGSRFLPAKERGKPVDYWIIQPYRFDLKQD